MHIPNHWGVHQAAKLPPADPSPMDPPNSQATPCLRPRLFLGSIIGNKRVGFMRKNHELKPAKTMISWAKTIDITTQSNHVQRSTIGLSEALRLHQESMTVSNHGRWDQKLSVTLNPVQVELGCITCRPYAVAMVKTWYVWYGYLSHNWNPCISIVPYQFVNGLVVIPQYCYIQDFWLLPVPHMFLAYIPHYMSK